MKNITGTVQRSGNVDASGAVEMGFDASGIGHIMSILSNMYSNKFQAVLREYTCNARDSHVEAGQERPVEVTLPSDLQPTLLIQDYGLGMDKQTLIETYASYGKSTKGDSNEVVGAFGIGSKSAFTMGHQFVVTAVKDGQKVVALFALNEANIGTVQILREGPTEEPNGVLVSLAVEDVQQMREEAETFFSTWPAGTVLVDGETPASVFEGATKINDVTHLVKEHQGQVIVVMGSVQYVVGRDILRKVARDLKDTPASAQAQALVDWYDDTSLFFEVPIGSVDIAPSRENLRDTPRTLAVLSDLVSNLVNDLAASVQAKVDAARNPFEARLILERALDDLGPFKVKRSSVPFNGMELKKEIEVPLPVFMMVKKSWRGSTMIVGREDKYVVDANRAPQTVVVVVPEGEESKVQRYVKRFLENYTTPNEDGSLNYYKYVVATSEASGEHDWFVWGQEGGAHTLTLEEYRAALRTMRDSNPRTKSEPSYSTGWGQASRDLEDRDLLTDIISWGKDIIVYQDNAYADALMRDALQDYTIVVLLGTQSRNALIKRVEEDGSVKVFDGSVRDLIEAHAKKVFANISKDEKAAMGAAQWLEQHSRYDWDAMAKTLGGREKITSKTFQDVMDAFDLAELVSQDITKARRQVLAQVANHLGSKIDIPTFDMEIPEVEEAYPLVGHLINHSRYVFSRDEALQAEALAYINAR